MKYDFNSKLLGWFYLKASKKGLLEHGVDKRGINDIKKEYKDIILRAKDIGKAQLLSSYVMAAYFIAMVRKTSLTPDELYEIFEKGLMTSSMFKAMMGDADSYFDLKRTAKRKEWSKYTYEKNYENDWVVDVLDKTDTYELGYDYHECGVCKLCKDEGCPELAKYLCALDFPIAKMMGMKLERTQTLAEGGDCCDFRYSRLDKKEGK